MSIIISLFDYTAEMVKPWARAGYDCFCFDIQHPNIERTAVSGGGSIIKVPWNAEDGVGGMLIHSPVEMVFSFAPCTDLAVSGAAHFKKKLKKDPDVQKRATRWARLAETLAQKVGAEYMVENPVSVLSSLWRKPDYYFHPWEYGGYIDPAHAYHPTWPEYITPYDAYPKKTCLWTSDGFVMPEKKPVHVEKGYSIQHLKLGGKSLKTKNIRSATPRGFAQAVFEANSKKKIPAKVRYYGNE